MTDTNTTDDKPPITKAELISGIRDMIDAYERVPQHGLMTPVTHYDHLSLLMLIYGLFKDETSN